MDRKLSAPNRRSIQKVGNMKLLFCKECQDLFKLSRDQKACDCGESSGRYLEDGLHAEVSGPCLLLGMDNNSLLRALRYRRAGGIDSMDLDAFLIAEDSDRFKRIG